MLYVIFATANTLFIGWVSLYLLTGSQEPMDSQRYENRSYWADSPEYDYNPND